MLTLGCMETDKAANLSKVLNLHIDPKHMVVSHTPMRELASIYGGSNRCFTLESFATAIGSQCVFCLVW